MRENGVKITMPISTAKLVISILGAFEGIPRIKELIDNLKLELFDVGELL